MLTGIFIVLSLILVVLIRIVQYLALIANNQYIQSLQQYEINCGRNHKPRMNK